MVACCLTSQWSGRLRAAHFGAAHRRVSCHPMDRNLESPRRIVMAAMAPIAVVVSIVMFLVFDDRGWKAAEVVFESILVVVALCVSLSAISPRGFWWAPRLVAFVIFLAYLVYFFYEILFVGDDFSVPVSAGSPSAFNALRGLCFFGIPCLLYAIFGSSIGPIARLKGDERPTEQDLFYWNVSKNARRLLTVLGIISVAAMIYKAHDS